MSLLEIIGHVSNMAGAIGGVVAAIGIVTMRRAQKRQEENIVVRMLDKDGDRMVPIPLQLLRRDVSRAELLGRIGMLPMQQKGARFSIRYMSTPAFMTAINNVVRGDNDILTILVTREEIEQFDL